jgi:predicted GNAT superfamily acetyltransferase
MIVVRSCHGQEELEACVELQVATWGYDPTDVIPRKAFLVWQKVGGQVLAAFDTDLSGSGPDGDPSSLIAFLAALPGIKAVEGSPRPYLHSHMLAVKDAYRNRGLGARLKLAQREEALSRGIRHIEWTFDPLEIKNAFLNISKLGAIARTYLVDFYGVSSSRLQGGLPTDRLVAEWQIDSPRVKTVLSGENGDRSTLSPVIREQILVPARIYEWKATEKGRERALEVQLENRRRFQRAFAEGLVVSGFVRDAEGNGIYQLGDSSHLSAF